MAESELKNLPTNLGDDTSLLPLIDNITYIDLSQRTTGLGAGDTFVIPDFLNNDDATNAFNALVQEIPYQQWYHMASQNKSTSGLKPLSRTKCALALPTEDGLMPHYRFPVNDQQRYPVIPINEKTPTLYNILMKIQKTTGILYNHVVVLYYKDGNDAIGFHKDKTLDLEENSPIISVSLQLGQSRPYVLRKDHIFQPTDVQQFTLPHGCLLSLGPKTNENWYHAIIAQKDNSTLLPRISITCRHVKTFRNIHTGEITGKGSIHNELNWPMALRGHHRTDYYLDVPLECSEVLEFWFGDKVSYNGGLWWRGMMFAAEGKNEDERKNFTDKFIFSKWSSLINSNTGLLWAKSPLGLVGAIILYDQLPRHAFRNTSQAFQFDQIACELANKLLNDYPEKMFLSVSETTDTSKFLPWTFQIFVFFALLHSENISNCERGANGLANLHEILKNLGFSEKSSKLIPLLKSAKEHIQILSKFGRYPHRNEILNRQSTSDELIFIKENHFSWMKSQIKLSNTKIINIPTESNSLTSYSINKSKTGFRILVLHSNRQSSLMFQKRTRNVLARTVGPASTLVYASAPHKYVAQGEALNNTKHLRASNTPSTRCWWNATDDPETMIYNGLDETIKYIDDCAKNNGPFDGIIGFSQGGTLAGILAALVYDKSEKVQNLTKTLQFCVIISGFPIRDTRKEYINLNGPLRDKNNPIAFPSFHVWGLNDFLVTPERSISLYNSFSNQKVPRMSMTHNLDHFAKAIAVWPVDQIKDWIYSNFRPYVMKQTNTTLLDKLFAVRDRRYISNNNNDIDDQLAYVMEKLDACEDSILSDDVSVILLEKKIFTPKIKNIQATADALIQVATKALIPDNSIQWSEKIKNILSVFPNAITAFYIADKSVTIFRKGLVEIIVQSIKSSLESKKCDYIAEQLPNKNNHSYYKNGLLSDIVKYFPEFNVFRNNNKSTELDVMASYKKLLNTIKQYVDNTDYTGTIKRNENEKKGSRNANDLEELLNTPLCDAIINPTPEIVDIADSQEMIQLHSFLRNYPLDNTLTETVFPRGTLCSDGRLDLCKQVIGPKGVPDLELSLKIDGSSATPRIKHLLLGNNIAGLNLALSVSKLIKDKSTHITTWYIAGNNLDSNSISPIAEALQTDTQVLQLWLKRNPLKTLGAIPLGKMCSLNSYLQVLDLTNTGLLDEGGKIICDAIANNQNSALKVIYLESNGLTIETVPNICNMIQKSKITDLCLGCNRIGDKGVIMLAEIIQFLEHFELSSCGIGPRGVQVLADKLKTNTSLKKLDLGFLKSTNALGEIPNAMGNEGAGALASALTQNSTLLSLNILHNGIYQQGVSDLSKALITSNRTLLHLNIEQLGIPHNELTRETIRIVLKKNWQALSDSQKKLADSAINREHLTHIKSVYRNETL